MLKFDFNQIKHVLVDFNCNALAREKNDVHNTQFAKFFLLKCNLFLGTAKWLFLFHINQLKLLTARYYQNQQYVC